VVHGGAGDHPPNLDKNVKAALKASCTPALEALASGSHATRAVVEAISVLEDNPFLNAGYGSNLTLDGNVECDASIMNGRDESFGSVAAVSGVKNPISAAERLREAGLTPRPLGLVPPMILASQGAHAFATKNNITTVSPSALVSERATKDWNMWKWKLDQEPEGVFQDTVGALVLDSSGGLGAGVSSGGLLLKQSGRIGEAAIFGAGCWASSPVDTNIGVACSVSGEGEKIIRSSLARVLSERVLAQVDGADEIIQHVLIHSIHGTSTKVGLIILVKENDETGGFKPRLWCAFTTSSMAVAYASYLDPEPQTMIIRRPRGRGDMSTGVYLTSLPLTRS